MVHWYQRGKLVPVLVLTNRQVSNFKAVFHCSVLYNTAVQQCAQSSSTYNKEENPVNNYRILERKYKSASL